MDKLEPRACLWTGQMFRPSHPGQLFVDRGAALAFERSGMSATVLNPAHRDYIKWMLDHDAKAAA